MAPFRRPASVVPDGQREGRREQRGADRQSVRALSGRERAREQFKPQDGGRDQQADRAQTHPAAPRALALSALVICETRCGEISSKAPASRTGTP